MFAVRNLEHAYDGAVVLRIPDWRAERGEHWLVLGPSGSGKSTLLHVLAGLLRPTRGEVIVGGQRLDALKPGDLDRFRGRSIGIVLQQLHLVPTLTVEKNVLLAQYLAGTAQDLGRVGEVLESLDLAGKGRSYPHELSHGQAQRAAIARAVVNRPALLVADEPTSNLDERRCMQALELLESQATACNATLVIATHDRRITACVEKQLDLEAVA